MAEGQLSFRDKERLHGALLGVPDLWQAELRDICVSQVKERLSAAAVIHRHDEPSHDLWLLLSACESDARGLATLHLVLRGLYGDMPATTELANVIANGSSVRAHAPEPAQVAGYQRAQLQDLIAGQPIHRVEAAYRSVFEREPPPAWTDAGDILRDIEGSAPQPDALPLILTYVDRLAHVIDDSESALGMHRWVDVVATGSHMSQQWIRDLCLISGRNPDPTEVVFPKSPEKITYSEDDGALNMKSLPPGAVALVPVLGPTIDPAHTERRIRGAMPMRNPDFTGREDLLSALHGALLTRSQVAVLPQALHGQGGVGKTQLAAEYVYRYGHEYSVVWWISAEQPGEVRSSLAALAVRMELPVGIDIQQTVNNVLSALAEGSVHWLLVYDNAGTPDDLVPLMPAAGGHVIITSRNPAWATSSIGDAIEVDVFQRPESVELLRKSRMSTEDAELLAERLGDLPLALEQAARWCEASGMEPREYLSLLDEHASELLAEGKPASYPLSLYASIFVAIEALSKQTPVAVELLEVMAFLGAEPLLTALLEWGTVAQADSALGLAQRNPIALRKAIRDLREYGLARVGPDRRTIQVHRLVQAVIRESLSAERAAQRRRDAQHLLASATPTDRLTPEDWPVFAAIVPHVLAADLINADDVEARGTIVNHMRYLFAVGDYERDRRLGELAIAAWSRPPDEGGLPADHELTLKAKWRLASALERLGEGRAAKELIDDTVARMTEHLGAEHETTLFATNSRAVIYRLMGAYHEALPMDEVNFERLRQVFGDDDEYTLDSQNSVAVNLRILGDFQRALEIDSELVSKRESWYGGHHVRTAFATANLARDLYGVGRYREALEMGGGALAVATETQGRRHADVLLAARTVAIALRKIGEYDEALRQSDANRRDYRDRFGPLHPYTLAATMSYAHCLRVLGRSTEAFDSATEAERGYTRTLGDTHPLTLTARVNLGIVLRAVGDDRRALRLDEETFERLALALGERHPYTLCAATSVTTDFVMHHRLDDAHALSQRTLELSREIRGDRHPYTLAVAINAAFDQMAIGERDQIDRLRAAGEHLYNRTIEALRATLGPDHPEVVDVIRGKRAECDIEPPPV